LNTEVCKNAVQACVDVYIATCGVEETPCDGFLGGIPGIDSRTQVGIRCNPDFVVPGTPPADSGTPTAADPNAASNPDNANPNTDTPSAATPTNNGNANNNMGAVGSSCSLNPGGAPVADFSFLSTLMLIPFALRMRKKKQD
jgi:hypothetical protein